MRKDELIPGQRRIVPENRRLAMVRVVSTGNSTTQSWIMGSRLTQQSAVVGCT
jgi:hypothetical protein